MYPAVALIVCPVFFALILIRKYRERTWGRCQSRAVLNDKVFIITGCNSGVGLETARELAKRHACVVMACRDMDKTKLAIRTIRKTTNSGQLIPMHLDLASFDSIKKFAVEALIRFQKIDVLINNAGVYFPMSNTATTKEGFEMNFGVNHLGHFLLTSLLLNRIISCAPSRIVIVSSTLHEKGEIDFNDLNSEKKRQTYANSRFNPGYCASKLANAYHCKELAKRLKGTGVDVFAVCPGFTYTNLFRYSNFKWWHYVIFSPIAFLYLRSPWKGAQTIIHCAIEEKLQGSSGHFYRDCKVYNSKVDFDSEIQTRLWEKSEELVQKVID